MPWLWIIAPCVLLFGALVIALQTAKLREAKNGLLAELNGLDEATQAVGRATDSLERLSVKASTVDDRGVPADTGVDTRSR